MSVLEVEAVSKAYRGRTVVDEVTFEVDHGEVFGILGPNGAGKTTLVECIGGLRRPDAGRIRVVGLDPQRDAARLRQVVGMQLQSSVLQPRLTVVEAVELYASMYPDPADPGELLELLGLSDRARVRYGTLSGGEQQRLSIALALVGRPQVAVLDESTAGLDPQARRDTWTVVEQVRDRGVTVVLVTHLMDEAERLCDRLALLDGGRIVALDSPAGLVASVVGQQRLRFRPSTTFDGRVLEELDEVVEVRRRNHEVVVTGTGNLVQAVMVRLEHAGVSPEGLQVSQHGLEDVFMSLTGRPLAAHRRSEIAR